MSSTPLIKIDSPVQPQIDWTSVPMFHQYDPFTQEVPFGTQPTDMPITCDPASDSNTLEPGLALSPADTGSDSYESAVDIFVPNPKKPSDDNKMLSSVVTLMTMQQKAILEENQKLKDEQRADREQMRYQSLEIERMSKFPTFSSMENMLRTIDARLQHRSRLEAMIEVAHAQEGRIRNQLSALHGETSAWRSAYDDMAQKIVEMPLCSRCCHARDDVWQYERLEQPEESSDNEESEERPHKRARMSS